jgi:hypothetical protein
VTSDLLLNFNDLLIISYRYVYKFSHSEKEDLVKFVAKYKELRCNVISSVKEHSEINKYIVKSMNNDYYKIYQRFYTKNYRLRFEFDRKIAVKEFLGCFPQNSIVRNRVEEYLKNIASHSMDRLISLNNALAVFKSCPRIRENCYQFALDMNENNNYKSLAEIIRYIEFAAANYVNLYLKQQEKYADSWQNYCNKNQKKKEFLLNSITENPEKIREIWEDLEKSLKNKKSNILCKPDIFNEFCQRSNAKQSCKTRFGFNTVSSFLYHFVKHPIPGNNCSPIKYLAQANLLIRCSNGSVTTLIPQDGNGRLYYFNSEGMLNENAMAILFVDNEGLTSILTFKAC